MNFFSVTTLSQTLIKISQLVTEEIPGIAMKTMKIILAAALALLPGLPALGAEEGEKATKTENVILVTLDGLRWEEVFRGLDRRFIDNPEYLAHKYTHEHFKQRFALETPEASRAAILPFLWGTVATQGQLYGNRDRNSRMSVTNAHQISYPGYSELLTGIADPRIAGNNKMPNPNRTVLEWVNQQRGFAGKVAAFGSWDQFVEIINRERSGLPVNAGFEPLRIEDLPEQAAARLALLNQLLADIPSWDTVRLDAFTFHFATTWLEHKRPRLLYIAFGETDDFAHDGHYDQYILAAHRADDFLARLWAWIQSDPQYRDKTTLLVTTDHGRGNEPIVEWRHHGRFEGIHQGQQVSTEFEGDEAIWLAAIGPDTQARGEMADTQHTQTQVAGTVAKLLGLEYRSDHPQLVAGEPIASVYASE